MWFEQTNWNSTLIPIIYELLIQGEFKLKESLNQTWIKFQVKPIYIGSNRDKTNATQLNSSKRCSFI